MNNFMFVNLKILVKWTNSLKEQSTKITQKIYSMNSYVPIEKI